MSTERIDLDYGLRVSGKVNNVPGVRRISQATSKISPLGRYLERKLDAAGVIPPNQETRRTLVENWIALAPRVVYDKMRSLRVITETTADSPQITAETFGSGITKLSTKEQGKTLTMFVSPPDHIPFSYRPVNFLPHDDDRVPVSASLSYLAKRSKILPDLPPLLISSGWNGLVLNASRIDLFSRDKQSAKDHLPRYINDINISLNTRYDATDFSIDDFFSKISQEQGDIRHKLGVTSPLYPTQEAHWIVTRKDGTWDVMSRSDLRTNDTAGFRDSLASVSSLLGYIDEKTYANDQPSSIDATLNTVVFFEIDGQRRIGSFHGNFHTHAKNMYSLARKFIKTNYPDAEKIAIGIIDGGGSSGAVVKKSENAIDTSTLPSIHVSHEIPMYMGLVPLSTVKKQLDRDLVGSSVN